MDIYKISKTQWVLILCKTVVLRTLYCCTGGSGYTGSRLEYVLVLLFDSELYFNQHCNPAIIKPVFRDTIILNIPGQ